MKIAHAVCTFPPDIGGMGQVVREEATHLVKTGNAVTVFTLNHFFSHKDPNTPFRVVRLDTLVRTGDAGFVPQLILRLKGFDVLHLHYPWYGGAAMVLMAAKLRRIPLVVTYHMDARPAGLMKRAFQSVSDKLFGRVLFKLAKKVLVVDRDHFKSATFSRAVDTQKIVDMPNAVNVELFKPQTVSLESLGLGHWFGKKILLFVGNMLPGKRLDLLLEAVAELNDPGLRLLIVGGGYAEAGYKEMITRLNLHESVYLAGRVADQPMVARYYAVADAVVIPSDEESFSLVALEAMASGKPVIGTAIPGLRHRIIDSATGFLFAKGSVQELIQAIQKVYALSPEERLRMGAAGRAWVVKDYTWSAHVARLQEVYQSVV